MWLYRNKHCLEIEILHKEGFSTKKICTKTRIDYYFVQNCWYFQGRLVDFCEKPYGTHDQGPYNPLFSPPPILYPGHVMWPQDQGQCKRCTLIMHIMMTIPTHNAFNADHFFINQTYHLSHPPISFSIDYDGKNGITRNRTWKLYRLGKDLFSISPKDIVLNN